MGKERKRGEWKGTWSSHALHAGRTAHRLDFCQNRCNALRGKKKKSLLTGSHVDRVMKAVELKVKRVRERGGRESERD